MPTLATLAPAADSTGAGASSLLILALPLLLLGWMFWSANRRQKQMRSFSSSLDVGEHVITSSGIFGTIRHLDDTSAWLEVAPGTTIRVDRRALALKQSDEHTSGVRPEQTDSPSAGADAPETGQ